MRIIRRILLVLFALIVISLITLVFLAPTLLSDLARNIENIYPAARILIVVVVDLLILGMLYSAMRSQRPAAKNALIVRSEGVVADVSTESARDRILKAVRQVPQVVSAEAKLEAVGGRADIEMDVLVAGDNVNVPAKQKEINRALQQVVLKQLGLRMADRPRIHIELQRPDAPPVAPPPPLVSAQPKPAVDVRPAAVVVPPAPPVESRPVQPEEGKPLFGWLQEPETKTQQDVSAPPPINHVIPDEEIDRSMDNEMRDVRFDDEKSSDSADKGFYPNNDHPRSPLT